MDRKVGEREGVDTGYVGTEIEQYDVKTCIQ